MKRAIVLTLVVAATMVALFACEKREDFPPVLPVIPPPMPTNFQVTSPADQEYDLTWDIDDPDNVVEEFWIYAYSAFTLPDTIGTTTNTSYFVRTAIPLEGLIFGVSSVSDQNVESDLAIEPAP